MVIWQNFNSKTFYGQFSREAQYLESTELWIEQEERRKASFGIEEKMMQIWWQSCILGSCRGGGNTNYKLDNFI